jgi:hypothetical protein
MAALLQRPHDRLQILSLALGPVLGAVLGAVLGIGACFIEPAPPGSLRFDCSSDSDCDPTQRCASGLCQQPCGSDGDESCASPTFCINGYCTGTCSLADDQCSSPQTCESLMFPSEEPPEEPITTGFCVIPCGDEAPCADGQVCVEEVGVCVQTCMVSEDCGDGEECLTGFCVATF